ncbi:MAG: methylated-DNA--[protein]-cysteine S-methyltransferase [Candidatus Thiodiazotropha endolucinida]
MSGTAQPYQAVVNFPFAPVGIILSKGRLKALEYLPRPQHEYRHKVPGLNAVIDAIQAYLDDPKWTFDLGLILEGTPFQCRVWQALQEIPSGSTLTYGELARQIGSGARAVGNACRDNPCPLIVPCHRVVGTAGLGGFAGERGGEKLEIKRWLLKHEGAL